MATAARAESEFSCFLLIRGNESMIVVRFRKKILIKWAYVNCILLQSKELLTLFPLVYISCSCV